VVVVVVGGVSKMLARAWLKLRARCSVPRAFRSTPTLETWTPSSADSLRTRQHDPSATLEYSHLSLRASGRLTPCILVNITAAEPATMGDVGEEEELDLNNPPFPLTAIDREILATKDEDYHRTTWGDLKRIIGIATSEPCKTQ